MSASSAASDERARISLRTRAAVAWTRVRELPGRLFPNAAELSRSFDLMPAPEAFDDGAINPLPDHNPIRDLPYGGVLYATDRAPATGDCAEPYYPSARGQVLRLGAARIEVGDTAMTWEEARRISLLKNRPKTYPLRVTGVTEFGILESTRNALFGREPGDDPAAPGRMFAAAINAKLAISKLKDVFIYVHGFKVVFENPALVAAELWHFLGYEGVFIAYAWPSTPRSRAYFGDADTAAGMARNLRELIRFLETDTDVRRIHLVGYSAGTRLVTRVLEHMALINRNAAPGGRRYGEKLGNVMLIGSDVDRELFAAMLADGVLEVADHMTVYVSSIDNALNLSRMLTGHFRVGAMFRKEEMTPHLLNYFAEREDRLSRIDVSHAANAASGNGHAYFRSSPWVSSDILMTLAYRLSPAERGLTLDPETGVWRFPGDYVARLRKALADRLAAEA
ncbi:alpha/beta hydrolase [Brevundimonas sp. Root1279]|uniref:alpha/beta hydrolase n=1 Tax=Brevundimonas sp. Root1279 TaxID=1736443 RepID=UPI000A98618C|nr:alpha/beta hydrolase [Brevundimonas sp. Root1279]